MGDYRGGSEESSTRELLLGDLVSTTSVEDLYQQTVAVIREIIDSDRCAVAVSQSNGLVVTESWAKMPELAVPRYPVTLSHPGMALENDQSCCFDDVTDTRSTTQTTAQPEQVRSRICVPITDDSVIIVESVTPNAFTEADTEHVETIADTAETVLAGFRTPSQDRLAQDGGPSLADSWFETLFNQPGTMAAILDADGRVQRINQAGRDYLYSDGDEAVGQLLWEAPWVERSSETAEQLQEHVQEVQAGETVEYEGTYGDQIVTVALQPVTDSDESLVSIVVTARDITEYRQQTRELQRLRERIEYALDVTDSYLWSVDLETGEVITFVGPIERISGTSREDLNDAHAVFDHFIHPDYHDEANQLFQQLQSGEKDHVSFEHRTPFDNSDAQWLRVTGQVELDGESQRLTGLATDITEQKQRVLESQRKKDQLDDFASVVSHDLRNPLNVATAYHELLCEECDSPHLEPIADAHERMEVLIDDLLTLARQGKTIDEVEAVDLSVMLPQCWKSVDTKNATLDVTVDRSVWADRSRLQQLFENLFRNAIEHGGADVAITVGEVEDGCGFYMADDGPGIPSDNRDAIFEAGYSTGSDGTGLGLSIVKRIVDAHNWEVGVTASTDGGAQFEMTNVEFE